jgi:hypothetical protein
VGAAVVGDAVLVCAGDVFDDAPRDGLMRFLTTAAAAVACGATAALAAVVARPAACLLSWPALPAAVGIAVSGSRRYRALADSAGGRESLSCEDVGADPAPAATRAALVADRSRTDTRPARTLRNAKNTATSSMVTRGMAIMSLPTAVNIAVANAPTTPAMPT